MTRAARPGAAACAGATAPADSRVPATSLREVGTASRSAAAGDEGAAPRGAAMGTTGIATAVETADRADGADPVVAGAGTVVVDADPVAAGAEIVTVGAGPVAAATAGAGTAVMSRLGGAA